MTNRTGPVELRNVLVVVTLVVLINVEGDEKKVGEIKRNFTSMILVSYQVYDDELNELKARNVLVVTIVE